MAGSNAGRRGFKRDRVGYSRHKAVLTQPTEDAVRHRRQPEILGRASDKQAIQPYEDAEAILAEATTIQEHLQTQDVVVEHLVARLDQAMTGLRSHLRGLAGVLPTDAGERVHGTDTPCVRIATQDEHGRPSCPCGVPSSMKIGARRLGQTLLLPPGEPRSGSEGAPRPASGVAWWWRGNEGCRRGGLRGLGAIEPALVPVWMGVGAMMTGAGDDDRGR